MVASRNHGNSLNGTNRSRFPSHSQKPWADTFATSTAEVLTPRCADFIATLQDDLAGHVHARVSQPIIVFKFDRGLEPELRFTSGVLATNTQDSRTHSARIAEL